MTALAYFRCEPDWSTRRIIIHLDPDSGYAIQGGRNDFEPNATRRIWNWIGAGNWLPGYRDYYGRAGGTDADTYATAMRTSYPILWDFRSNGIVIDVNGTPSVTYYRQSRRYDLGLYATLANGRDSWSADFKSFTQTWLSTH